MIMEENGEDVSSLGKDLFSFFSSVKFPLLVDFFLIVPTSRCGTCTIIASCRYEPPFQQDLSALVIPPATNS